VSDTPHISCVLAVWNGEAYLTEAIQSVLTQTFRDFELIVVDDGSTDNTAHILDRIRREDGRVRVQYQSHAGLVTALNLGMSYARGKYIARMDADDVSMPDRFAIQLEYLEKHQEIGICGSWIETFGNGASDVVKYPGDDGAIRCQLLFSSALAHPSTMLRRNVLLQHRLQYNETAMHAEDYDLWTRVAPYTRFANVPAVLLRYRVHPKQVGRNLAEKMEASSQTIRLAQLSRLGISPTPEEAQLHHNVSRWRFESSASFLSATREWFDKLLGANRSAKVYPEAEFLAVLGRRWTDVCVLATREGWKTLVEFWSAPHLALSVWSPWQHLKFAVKCLFRKDPHTTFLGIRRATH
jgi:glycosyltransferase involved in cell wall biosynthesis